MIQWQSNAYNVPNNWDKTVASTSRRGPLITEGLSQLLGAHLEHGEIPEL